jgi:hypothetical protein
VEIIFFDECQFNLKNTNFKGWQSKDVRIDYSGEMGKEKAMLLLASTRKGIVFSTFEDKYITTEVFVPILQRLKNAYLDSLT